MCSLSGPCISFLDVILAISDEFLTPASATKAQQNLERVTYTTTLGICAYVREVQNLSRHVFMPIDEYTLRRQIIAAIPQTICNWLIDYKDLSTSTSTVVEWVDTIKKQERELLEREAYNTAVLEKRSTRMYGTSTVCVATTTQTTGLRASRRQAILGTTPKTTAVPRTNDRGIPTGQQVPGRQSIPTAERALRVDRRDTTKGQRSAPRLQSPLACTR